MAVNIVLLKFIVLVRFTSSGLNWIRSEKVLEGIVNIYSLAHKYVSTRFMML
jgi:hypothetical protein